VKDSTLDIWESFNKNNGKVANRSALGKKIFILCSAESDIFNVIDTCNYDR